MSLLRTLHSLAGGICLVLLVLSGTVTDHTTGQPLAGVSVRTHFHGHVVRAITGASGRYSLPGLAPGRYTLRLSSKDVPPQRFHVTLRAGGHYNLRACSTTLDYSCGAPAQAGG
ncbi:MAG: carboxypeptidase-like regulatory domain-containing protein [Vulcanimicrobiaceae bacterium]